MSILFEVCLLVHELHCSHTVNSKHALAGQKLQPVRTHLHDDEDPRQVAQDF